MSRYMVSWLCDETLGAFPVQPCNHVSSGARLSLRARGIGRGTRIGPALGRRRVRRRAVRAGPGCSGTRLATPAAISAPFASRQCHY